MRRFQTEIRDALERVYQTYVQKIANLVRYGIRLPGGAVRRWPGLPRRRGRGSGPGDLHEGLCRHGPPCLRRRARLRPLPLRHRAERRGHPARRTGRELPTPFAELERAHDAELGRWPQTKRRGDRDIAVVRAYLEGLDAELRRVHEARYVLGLSQRDAADRLGISRQNLRTLEGRVRDGLRRELERLGLSTRRVSRGP